MSPDLSVAAPEVEAGPEPPKHDQELLDAVRSLIPEVRRNLAALRLTKRYDGIEVPGVGIRDIYGPGARDTGRPVTLHEALYGESSADKAKRTAEGRPAPPPRGAELDRAIETTAAHLQVLEDTESEQMALAEAHKEWAMASGGFDPADYPTDPVKAQVLVGTLDAQVQAVEEKAERLLADAEAALARAREAEEAATADHEEGPKGRWRRAA